MYGRGHILMVFMLFCSIYDKLSAQTADSSIFRKPLKIEASVKTERAARSEQKGDTLIFNSAAYQVVENADSERLISKMPGISVSDGGIEANGKEIARILLDGQEFFGNDVITALRNVPADMVKQIEIINKLSDSAQQTGVDDGEGYTAINIVTKRKKGAGLTTGRIYGSYGLSDKADHRHNYIAGGNLSHFTDKRTISVIGMSNNISKFNFTSSDILSGSTGLDARGGKSFKVKSLSGISDVHAIGFNYSDKKCNFNYFFNDIRNRNHPVSDKLTMTSSPDKNLLTHYENHFNAHNMNHRFSGKISLAPDKRHRITIRPSVTFNDMSNWRDLYSRYTYLHSNAPDKFERTQLNNNDNDRWSISAAISASYTYRFKKRRRSFNVYGRYSYYRYSSFEQSWEYRWKEENPDYADLSSSYYRYFQNRDRLTSQHGGTGKATYTEPLTKRSLLSAEYTFSMVNTDGENLVYPFDNKCEEYASEPKTRVSAINNSVFYHNRAGIRYNYTFRKMTIAASATYQNTIFEGKVKLPSEGTSRRTYHYPLYMVKANIPFNKSNTLKLEAKGYTKNPSNSSLQDVVDRSNTSNVRAGNPNLSLAYLNEAEIRYINTNRKRGTTFSFSAVYAGSHNSFCDSLVINNPDFVVMKDDDGKEIKLGNGNQFIKPINLGGYRKISVRSAFAMPLDFIRCNFNIGAAASLQRIPGMVNEEVLPVNRNWLQVTGRLDSNISKNIDFTVSYLARYTMNEYNGKYGRWENNYMTHRVLAELKWIFLKRYTFTGAFLYKKAVSTDGLYDDNIYLCDLFIGRKFLKDRKLEISAGVNDLFNNKVKSFWHSLNATGKTDGYNIGIGRYFSLQCIWHFRQGTRPKKIIR